MARVYAWEYVFVPNREGELLSALLLFKEETDTCVVMCHGFAGNKQGRGMAALMAEGLWEMGYSSLLFDFAGSGDSEGSFEDTSLSKRVSDLSAVVDFLFLRGFRSIVEVGRRFGGTTAVCQASGDSRVSGICTWSAPVNVKDVFRLPDSFRNSLSPGKTLAITSPSGDLLLKHDFYLDLCNHDVRACGADLAPRPLLVIHAGMDQIVPLHNGEALYGTAAKPKQLSVIGGADHDFTGCHHLVWRVLFDWLLRYFRPRPQDSLDSRCPQPPL